MSTMNNVASGGSSSAATVKVWDLFVRVFHWSLVTLFLIAYVTGDEIEKVHIVVGYTIAFLIASRVVWGFVGPHHARFGNFVRSPRETLAYLRDELRFKAPRHIGHNPAAAAMIVTLLVMLVATCATGYVMTTDAFWGAEWVEEVHEASANITVGLTVVHVLAALMASFMHRENLVWSMITGKKRA
ncbi:MAG: cytochrome b/b6 domain-containing protein [Burkholderiales bacterium]|jgi:cytochrome b|nr:cytochrome b/b6 domain-containing protein [Burkholderiales bacterium]